MPIAPAQVPSRINTRTNVDNTHHIAESDHETYVRGQVTVLDSACHVYLGLPLPLQQNKTLWASSNMQACFYEFV